MPSPTPPPYVPTDPEAFKVEFGKDTESFTARLVAARAFSKGERIGSLSQSHPSSVPVYSTVQVGQGEHVELDSDLRYTNHSCRPSTIFDTTAMEVRAARDLAPGEELTYFYPSTEWKMAQAFPCWCGSDQCIGEVRGAFDLPSHTLQTHTLNAHIHELVQDQGHEAPSN